MFQNKNPIHVVFNITNRITIWATWIYTAWWYFPKSIYGFWEVDLFRYASNFEIIVNNIPLEEALTLYKNTELEFSSAKDSLCQCWFKIDSVFLRSWKCYKYTDIRTDRHTDATQRMIKKSSFKVQLWGAKLFGVTWSLRFMLKKTCFSDTKNASYLFFFCRHRYFQFLLSIKK